MIYRSIFTVVAVLFASIAAANYNEAAYEVEARLMNLPASISGSVIVRECNECQPYTHRVTATTQYRLNGTVTTLDRLRALLTEARNQEAVFVVAYDIETRNVSFIALDL